jgi:hypothetical protein
MGGIKNTSSSKRIKVAIDQEPAFYLDPEQTKDVEILSGCIKLTISEGMSWDGYVPINSEQPILINPDLGTVTHQDLVLPCCKKEESSKTKLYFGLLILALLIFLFFWL